jgi:hypothetical protein
MQVSEVFPDLDQRSSLPPGGDPRLDKAYSDWLRDWLDTAEPRALDALTGPDGEVCPGAAKLSARLNPFRVTGHLAKWLIGWEFPSGTGPTFCHRQRFVAVQFHLRRAALVAEADAYLGRIIDELRNA